MTIETLVAKNARIAAKYTALDLDDDGDEPDGREQWRSERWSRIVPSRFAWATLDDFTDPAAATYAPTIAADLAQWARGHGGNLLIFGPVGVGKTHAAIATARARFFDHAADVRFYPVVELLDALRPGGDEDGALRRLCKVDLLVIDDLGSERPTDWTAERMYALINRRWLDESPTIFTSNLWPTKATADSNADVGMTLDEAVGPRVFSRLVGSDSIVLRMTGPDRRRETR